MSGLKDMCLQVRYEGRADVLAEEFYGPVSKVASLYRIRTTSFVRESLLPVSLKLSQILGSRKPVHFLVALPTASGAQGADIPKSAQSIEAITNDLLSQLRQITDGAKPENPENLVALAAYLELRIASGTQEQSRQSESTPISTGYFTDQSDATVSYETEYPPAVTNGIPVPLSLAISWSWGDPQFKVKKTTESFDKIWNNADDNFSCIPGGRELTLSLLTALLYLEQHTELDLKPDTAIHLFQHQQNAIDTWKSHDFRGVFKMCTGAGKTISSLAGVHALAEERTSSSLPLPPVVVSVPTRVLADQWIREIKRCGFHSIVPAYNAFEQWSRLLEPTLRSQNSNEPRFIVTTYRTFGDERFIAKLQRAAASRIEALWIADEMHNLASPRLRDVMRQTSDLFKFRLGLSATPEIEGDLTATEQLLNYFGGICASYELKNGIEDGVLCPYRYYPVPAYLAPELGQKYLRLLRDIQDTKSGSSSLMNLYRETRELLRTSGIQVAKFRDLLGTMCQANPDIRHTLIYCPPGYGTYDRGESDEVDTDAGDRRLIEDVIEVLRGNGLSASSILGETPADQRAQILQRFGDGRLNTLCAIGCLDEGVDVPSIQRAIVLYSVDREKQFIQRRGRILRQPRGVRGKIAEIFDIVILPQGSEMPTAQAEALLNRELRRYRKFAELALNREDADAAISTALSVATRGTRRK